MKITKLRTVPIFSVAGFVVGAFVLGFYFWETTHTQAISAQLSEKLTNYSLIVCPPCFGVMALDNAGPTGWTFGIIEITIINAALYGLVGFIVDKVYKLTIKTQSGR